MPQTVYIKDYDTEITIPDGADMAQVRAALKRRFPAKTAQPQAQAQQPPASGLQRAAQAVRPYTRGTFPVVGEVEYLPLAGAMFGGAAAAPGNVIAPGVASLGGAGLGYAAGRKLQDFIDVSAGAKDPSTLPQALASTATDIPIGAAMEAGGAIIGKPIQAGIKAAGPLAKRLYESVAKIPPRSVPKAVRDKAIETALKYKIKPTEKGFKKLRGMIEATNEQISTVINDASTMSTRARELNKKTGRRGEFDEDMIEVRDVLKRLQGVREWAKNSYPDPTPIYKIIDEYRQGVMQSRGARIAVDTAQKLKQGIYRRLTDSAYGEYSTPVKEIEKSIARGLKEELVEKYPILESLNSKDSALIGLADILEKTVNRTRNWDVVGLSDYAGAIGGGTLAGGSGAGLGMIAAKVLRSPSVMSSLAFALKKASARAGAPLFTRVAGYEIANMNQDEMDRIGQKLAPIIEKANPAETAEAVEVSPAVDYIRSGQEAYLSGNMPGAIIAFKRAIKADPSKAEQFRLAINMIKREQNALNARARKNQGGMR